MNVGTEAEFMLLKQDEHGGYAPWDALDTLDKPCYDVRALYRNLDIITTLVGYMQDLGWEPYASDHEDATCQFELNWLYSDGLTTADRHTFFLLDGQDRRRGERSHRHVHAQAVPEPYRQRGALPRQSLGHRPTPPTCFWTKTTRTVSPN